MIVYLLTDYLMKLPKTQYKFLFLLVLKKQLSMYCKVSEYVLVP